MSDLLIRRAQPSAIALIEAVGIRDQAAVAEVLTTLDRDELYALAVVLAGYCAPSRSVDRANLGQLRQAIGAAGATFGLHERVVRSRDQTRPTLDARAVACYVGRLLGLSYPVIGRELGRDHTTIMHAVSRVGETPRLRRIAQSIAADLGWNRDLELPVEVGA